MQVLKINQSDLRVNNYSRFKSTKKKQENLYIRNFWRLLIRAQVLRFDRIDKVKSSRVDASVYETSQAWTRFCKFCLWYVRRPWSHTRAKIFSSFSGFSRVTSDLFQFSVVEKSFIMYLCFHVRDVKYSNYSNCKLIFTLCWSTRFQRRVFKVSLCLRYDSNSSGINIAF